MWRKGYGEELGTILEGKLGHIWAMGPTQVEGRKVVMNLKCFGKENLGIYGQRGTYG
jgi:hypothetical protein